MLEPDLIESDAFLNLSGGAAYRVLIRFYQKAYRKKVKGKKGLKNTIITNQGEIIFTYSEAKELNVSSRTFRKVLHEIIVDKGFIDIAEQGIWYLKQSTKFSISNRWRKYGTPEYQPGIMPSSK